MRGFVSRAGHLLGRALASFGLGAPSSSSSPTPTAGAAGLPTHVVLLSPARRGAHLLTQPHRKVKVLGG